MSSLTLIGYWRADADTASPYPDPRDLVDPGWDDEERTATWAYFATGTLFRASAGRSPCRVCGRPNGSVEYTDGTYVWPEGLAHYVRDHAVRLPDELVRHATSTLDALDGREVVDRWWVAATTTR